jgi:peptidoglycan hydrolase-like protein with peptidoglycan-binding domain
VRALQRRLGLHADGVYGAATWRAVRAFQARHGLEVDGLAGPQTLGALGLAGSSDATAAAAQADPAPPSPVLARIARCESGGNAAAVSADGVHRGKYQFDRATWASVGGTGDPAAAPESVQDRLAAILYAQRGTAPWPQCGAASAR